MSAADDREDVGKVLAGDIDAFEGIVRRWQGPLVNLAWRFCRDRARAEEMAQEAFLRAYRALGKWRQDGAFSTWLFALAANLYRTELRRVPAAIPLDSVPEPPAPSTPGFEQEDRDTAVRHAVATLPPKYRDAVVLFYFHERDVASAAQTLGLPEGTVKARLSRARDLLRGKLSRPWRTVNA